MIYKNKYSNILDELKHQKKRNQKDLQDPFSGQSSRSTKGYPLHSG